MTSEQSRAISRRKLLGGWILGGIGILHWLGFDKSDHYSPTFCPTDEELESMSWIRGRFEEDRKSVTPGGSVVSTIRIRNDGGVDGEYEGRVWIEDEDTEDPLFDPIAEDLLEASVPAKDHVEKTVELELPTDFDGGHLAAERLGSSCDLVMSAIQILEVDE